MSEKLYLTHGDINELAARLCAKIIDYWKTTLHPSVAPKIYAIPRGGIPVLYLLKDHLNCVICENPGEADVFVDDIIDSGETAARYGEEYPETPFFALIDEEYERNDNWIVFPWEVATDGIEEGVEANVTRILQYIGEDPTREGLLETPKRVSKAWLEWCSGYDKNPADVLKVFEDGGENYDEMVIVTNIPFYSLCEHHMAPFFGTATIAYVPDGKIVGLSKLSRLLDIYARRLQVQERMTSQIADALMEHLEPKGSAVYISARHLCMESRGVAKQGQETVTTALRGCFMDKAETRAEFLSLAR